MLCEKELLKPLRAEWRDLDEWYGEGWKRDGSGKKATKAENKVAAKRAALEEQQALDGAMGHEGSRGGTMQSRN